MKTLRYVCLFAALLIDGMAVQKQNLQLASFDQVWSTIREWHWDQEKVGAAWDRARAELRPQAEQEQTPEQVRPIIAKLLATLGESHFYVIPAETYDSMQNGGAGGAAEPEFDFRILDGRPLIQKIGAAIPNNREAELIAWATIHRKLSGPANQTKSLAFVTGSGECSLFPISSSTRLSTFLNCRFLVKARPNSDSPFGITWCWNCCLRPQWPPSLCVFTFLLALRRRVGIGSES